MSNIDRIAKEFDRVEEEIFYLFANEKHNGEPIISGDTLNDYIEIVDIMSRVMSRKINEIKSEYESIL